MIRGKKRSSVSCPQSRACVCVCQRNKNRKKGTVMCVSKPVTLHWTHIQRQGAQSAVKSTINVVCCVMTALQRLVTARASNRNERPTACVCKHTDSAQPKTLTALFHVHGTCRRPRGSRHCCPRLNSSDVSSLV